MKWWAWALLGAVLGGALVGTAINWQDGRARAEHEARADSLRQADAAGAVRDSLLAASQAERQRLRDSLAAAGTEEAQNGLALDAAIARRRAAERRADAALAEARTSADSIAAISAQRDEARGRANEAELATASARRHVGILMADTTLLAAQYRTEQERRAEAERRAERWRGLAEAKPPVRVGWKVFGIQLPPISVVLGGGVTTGGVGGTAAGLTIAGGIELVSTRK